MTWNNTFRPILIPAILPLGLGAVGCLIILSLVSAEQKMAGCALVVAVVGMGMNIIKNIQEAVSKANPLHATPFVMEVGKDVGKTFVIGLEVFNHDTTTVHIKDIKLIVKGEDSELLAESSKAEELEHQPIEPSFPEGVSRFELTGKKTAKFHLDRNSERKWDWPLDHPHQTFWIEIECFGGAMVRISGKKIQDAVKKRFPELTKLVMEHRKNMPNG